MRRRPVHLWLGLVIGGILVGAGGCKARLQTYPARGRVVLSSGAPVTGGYVSFESRDRTVSATGRIQPDGSFHLSTLELDDGIPAGEYQAVVVPPASAEETPPPPQFHSRYQRYQTSGLAFTVVRGNNQFEIRLDPP